MVRSYVDKLWRISWQQSFVRFDDLDLDLWPLDFKCHDRLHLSSKWHRLPNLNCLRVSVFWGRHGTDRQTDGQTDGRTDGDQHLTLLCRGIITRNNIYNFSFCSMYFNHAVLLLTLKINLTKCCVSQWLSIAHQNHHEALLNYKRRWIP